MATTLLLAFALMLILEGLLPFLAPGVWREAFRRITQLTDGQIRFFGLTSMLIGLLLLALAHWSCRPTCGARRSRSRSSSSARTATCPPR
jgi:uncharacterized protein YjeT (DUF2065 family)